MKRWPRLFPGFKARLQLAGYKHVFQSKMEIDDKLQNLYAMRFDGELSRKNAKRRVLIGVMKRESV